MERDRELPEEPTTAEPPPFEPDPDLITYIERGQEPAEERAEQQTKDLSRRVPRR
jgi:hypothetical protein